MYHHDTTKSYEEAASAAAAQGRVKMEEVIHKGLANTQAVVDRVLNTMIVDQLVKADAINVFSPDDKKWHFRAGDELTQEHYIHPHAFGQIVESAGMPRKFVDEMVEQANGTRWGAELILRHVRGHKGGSGRNWVNNECDRIAKRYMRQALKAKRGGAT